MASLHLRYALNAPDYLAARGADESVWNALYYLILFFELRIIYYQTSGKPHNMIMTCFLLKKQRRTFCIYSAGIRRLKHRKTVQPPDKDALEGDMYGCHKDAPEFGVFH